MYNNYQVKIIKNDIPLPKETGSDESDYEYLYDDELQILSENDKLIFTLRGYEFKSYDILDNYIIFDIDEGHKFTAHNLFVNLDTFMWTTEFFDYNNNYYFIQYDKLDKKIVFEGQKYDIKYFFENRNNIVDEYEYDRHCFDTTKDTLLLNIFKYFNLNVDNKSQIKIYGFTYGMSCHDIGYFKNILRDYTISIEKQLTNILFKGALERNMKIYDINFTITYFSNGIEKKFSFILECKDKEYTDKESYNKAGNVYFGLYDENAKLKLID